MFSLDTQKKRIHVILLSCAFCLYNFTTCALYSVVYTTSNQHTTNMRAPYTLEEDQIITSTFDDGGRVEGKTRPTTAMVDCCA